MITHMRIQQFCSLDHYIHLRITLSKRHVSQMANPLK